MTRRTYVEVASSYAPFNNAVLQGLGAAASAESARARDGWPAGRSYVGIAHFRAPYDEFGYFQDGSLEGLGAMKAAGMKGPYVNARGQLGAIAPTEMLALNEQAPGSVKRFLVSGEPVSSLRSDVTLPFNQVHPYVYGGLAIATAALGYYSYKRWKKTQPGGTKA